MEGKIDKFDRSITKLLFFLIDKFARTWGVVLDAFHHNGTLLIQARDHYSPGKANARVWTVTTSSDLIACIDNANVVAFGQDARDFLELCK